MRIAMGCCETVVLGFPRPYTAMVSCVLSGKHMLSEEQEEMYDEYISGVQRGVASARRVVRCFAGEVAVWR